MTEIDDKLFKDFFAEQKQEIADNGFSRRVMHHLPNRSNRLSQWCTTIIMAIAVILFFTLNGFQAVIATLREVFVNMVQSGASNLDPKSLLIAVVVLAFLGARKVYSMV